MYKDPEIDLFLKTEQLLYFRLTLALASLVLCAFVGLFLRAGYNLSGVSMLVGTAALYAFVGLLVLAQGNLTSKKMLGSFNAGLIGADIVLLTGLVVLTRGIDSD